MNGEATEPADGGIGCSLPVADFLSDGEDDEVSSWEVQGANYLEFIV